MKKVSTTSIASPRTGMGAVDKAWDAVSDSHASHDPVGNAALPAHDGAQERTAGRGLGRS
jgi:hypothetical protein